MSITAITIRNFRSIVSFNDKVQDLNIFVGQNDVGKSNVLRALDLFFNGDKRHGYEMNWTRDYCAFAPERVRKAEEIIIALEITPPQQFKTSMPIVWRKVWSKEALHSETVEHRDGTGIGRKSKLTAFLRAMRFDYVPAIKGEEYFQDLMASLHDMLEVTVEKQVREASGSFTKTINDNTKPILEGILKQLELETTIELPASLRDLFAQLEFTSISDKKSFSLTQRGDGVKVRHIPIVLRWLADQANFLSARGRPKTVTVWGYEEPENNLELRRCFELAQQFVNDADTIQAFVTTHSPAFYSVCRENDPGSIGLFQVTKEDSPPTTTIKPLSDGDFTLLDSSMGLLDFLEPHYREAREESSRLRERLKSLQDTTKPTIFCEGPSDKALIEAAMKDHFPALEDKLIVRCSDHHGGGHAWVANEVIAWSLHSPEAKAVGLFDKDKAAQDTRQKLNKKVTPGGRKHVAWVSLAPASELKECFKKNISVPYAIHELVPKDVWYSAKNQGWLEDRSNPISLYKFNRVDITFNEYIAERLPDAHHRRLALKKVKGNPDMKAAFSQYVTGLPDEGRKRCLEGLKPTIEECLKKLGLSEEQA